jgi:tetratricopeptide (TPR) repeat protein
MTKTFVLRTWIASRSRYVSYSLVVVACAWVLAGASGCSDFPPLQLEHKQAKEVAQERWDRVRSGVKFQLAEQHYLAGRIDECISEARRAAALDPEGTAAHVLLAHALLEKGNVAAAAAVIEEAVAIQPENPRVIYLQGVLAERDQHYEEAIEFYRAAGELDPSLPDYVASEAECLVSAGRPQEAMDLLNSRREDFHNDPTVEILRAEVAKLLGDNETALDGLSTAMRTVSDSMVVSQDYGLLLERSGRGEEALAVLGPLYAKSKDDMSPIAIRALGAAYLATRRPFRAKQVLADLVDEHGDDPHDWQVLARAALACADWTTARRCADRLGTLAPDQPLSHFLTAFVCWKQNENEKAEQALKTYLMLEPDDAIAYCLLGDLCRRRYDVMAARKHFNHALRLDPQCTWARTALSEINRLSIR